MVRQMERLQVVYTKHVLRNSKLDVKEPCYVGHRSNVSFGGTSVLSCYWESFTLSCLLLTYSFVCCCCVVVFLFFYFSSLVLLLNDIFLWFFLIFALSKEATIILFYRNQYGPMFQNCWTMWPLLLMPDLGFCSCIITYDITGNPF